VSWGGGLGRGVGVPLLSAISSPKVEACGALVDELGVGGGQKKRTSILQTGEHSSPVFKTLICGDGQTIATAAAGREEIIERTRTLKIRS